MGWGRQNWSYGSTSQKCHGLQATPEAKEKHQPDYPLKPSKNMVPTYQTSSLKNCWRIKFCSFKPSSCGNFNSRPKKQSKQTKLCVLFSSENIKSVSQIKSDFIWSIYTQNKYIPKNNSLHTALHMNIFPHDNSWIVKIFKQVVSPWTYT